eukprot:146619_1
MALSKQEDINEDSKHFLLILGYIHLNCINFNNVSTMVFVPSKVVKLILKYHRHRFSVYAIGMNKYEEFGDVNMNIRKSHVIHNINIRGFQKCDEFSNLLCAPIDNCIYYGRHKFMIKNDYLNKIYVAGHNNLGQCGVNSRELEIDEFTVLTIPDSNNDSNEYIIKVISNGICAKHSFIITQEKKTQISKIYAFGTNKFGQFGTEKSFLQPQIYPLELVSLSEYLFISLSLDIIQICCGEKHSIFLAKSGIILGCGLNDRGQCGIEYDEDYEYILEPEKIVDFGNVDSNINVKIVSISCGREHTLCLDIIGKIWVFGVNTNGELGIGKNKNEFEWIDQPMCISNLKCNKKFSKVIIKKISTGERHSMFIDNKYGLWLCGSNWYNQIGNINKSFTDCQKIPFKIQSIGNQIKQLKNIKIIDGSCGDYHSIVLDSNNNIYTWGANDSYQCHPPMFNGSDLQKVISPRRIDKKHINIGPHDIITHVIGAASATLLIVE